MGDINQGLPGEMELTFDATGIGTYIQLVFRFVGKKEVYAAMELPVANPERGQYTIYGIISHLYLTHDNMVVKLQLPPNIKGIAVNQNQSMNISAAHWLRTYEVIHIDIRKPGGLAFLEVRRPEMV